MVYFFKESDTCFEWNVILHMLIKKMLVLYHLNFSFFSFFESRLYSLKFNMSQLNHDQLIQNRHYQIKKGDTL
jgi:hypothetical protein